MTINQLIGKKVRVHWHFHKKLFSVTYKGRVVGHFDQVILDEPVFRVSEAGRKRVLREKRKNVHAFVYGRVSKHPSSFKNEPQGFSRIGYNPYKKPWFYHQSNGRRVGAKELAILWHGGIYA